MIISPVKKVLGLGVVLGVGGLGLYGGNELSKKTISDSLGEVKLVNEPNKSSSSYLDLISNLWKKSSPKTEKFKKVASLERPDKSFLHPDDVTQHIKLLKEACEESTSETYSSLFSKNDDLMDDVKNFCSFKVSDFVSLNREAFDFSGDSYKEGEESPWINNLKNLKKMEKSLLKNSELSTIWDSIPGDGNNKENIKPLFEWCKGYSEKYYVNDEGNIRENFKSYCLKDKFFTDSRPVIIEVH